METLAKINAVVSAKVDEAPAATPTLVPVNTRPAPGPEERNAARAAAVQATAARLEITGDAQPAQSAARANRIAADALPAKATAKHDYVFVGGGTAASIAAARMAEAGLKVLLLEAGADARVDNPAAKEPIESQIPAAHGIASESPQLAVRGTSYKVRHFSDDARNAQDENWDAIMKGFLYPRSGKIGGSGNMNAMIWVRPDRKDFEAIADATGDERWRWANVEKILQRIERVEYRPVLGLVHKLGRMLRLKALQNPHGLGMEGWLPINRPSPKVLLGDPQLLKMVWETTKFSLANLGTVGDKLSRLVNYLDPNDRNTQGTEGPVITPLAMTRDGRRAGPRDRLFAARDAHPDRIEIRSGATVEKVLLDDQNDARGVRYRDANGEVHDIAARHGVIVAAGAFETPAVLKRSGIGTTAELAPLGIETKVESPGLGEGLSDRYEYGYTFELNEPLKTLTDLQLPLAQIAELAAMGAERADIEALAKKSPAVRKWLEGNGGALATNGSVIAFQAKSDPSLDEPDLYIFLVAGDFHGYRDGYSKDAVADAKKMTFVILHENKGDQQGTVKLDPKNPNGPPLINFKYHEEDDPTRDDRLPIARAVVKYGRPLLAAFGKMVKQELLPGPEFDSVEKVANKIGRGTWGHHANHSARIGDPNNPMTVVRGDLSVIGATSLYAADASVLHNPGSFIVSSVAIVGEQMADIAIEKAKTTGNAVRLLAGQRQHGKRRRA